MVARAIEIMIEDDVKQKFFVLDSMLSESKSCLCVRCSKDEEGCHIARYLASRYGSCNFLHGDYNPHNKDKFDCEIYIPDVEKLTSDIVLVSEHVFNGDIRCNMSK